MGKGRPAAESPGMSSSVRVKVKVVVTDGQQAGWTGSGRAL